MSDPEIRRRLQQIAQERAQLEGAGFKSAMKSGNKFLKDSRILSTAAMLTGNPLTSVALGATGYGIGDCVSDMEGGYYTLRKDGSWSHKKSAATKGRKGYTKKDGTVVAAVPTMGKDFRDTRDIREYNYKDEGKTEFLKRNWRPESDRQSMLNLGLKIHEPRAPSDWNIFVAENYDDTREIVIEQSQDSPSSKEINRRTMLLLGYEYQRVSKPKSTKVKKQQDLSFMNGWFE